MPEQAALVGQADLGAVGELARLAEVVHERGGEQQVRIQTRMQLGALERERADRDGVLEQAAEVGVMASRACTARAATAARSASSASSRSSSVA